MRQAKLKSVRMLCFIIASMIPFISVAMKIDNTHYRFCVMDNASIKDQSAASAASSDRLPFFVNAYWYSYNGVKINGSETQITCSNSITSVNVFMTDTYNGDNRSLSHFWGRGSNGTVYDQTTYIYIEVDAPTGVSLNNLPSRMLIGEEYSIRPKLIGSYTEFSGSGYLDYEYSSSDPSVITIDSDKIIAKNTGIACITVEAYAKNKTYGGSYYIGQDEVTIEVVDNMDPTDISLDLSEITLNTGKEKTIYATVTPTDARTTITWSSSDNDIAVVNNGKISAINRGSCYIEARTSNGLSAKCHVTVLGEEDYNHELDIYDVNREWKISREDIINSQSNDYFLSQENSSSIVYSTMANGTMRIFISYKFDNNGKLCASTLSMPSNPLTQKFTDDFFYQFDSEMEVIDGLEVKISEDEIITVDTSSTLNGGNLITIGFSYYEPLEERDDCVDLGLSVRWAKTNLGADTAPGIGDFYAWGETNTKSEYWRENYAYCNNNANQYIFDYTNPVRDICGTKYDVATNKLGDGWRMPSLAEASELVTMCTWEKEIIDGIQVYRVTGPNGNSIIIPIVGWKKQRQEHSSTQLHLATGECQSRNDEYFYIITTVLNGGNYCGSIGAEWKAWGYNIRPVYTK